MGNSLRVLLLAASLTLTIAMICTPCPQALKNECDIKAIIDGCGDLGTQMGGCDCCPICNRDVNEECGGMFDRKCAPNLECKSDGSTGRAGLSKRGTCQPSLPLNLSTVFPPQNTPWEQTLERSRSGISRTVGSFYLSEHSRKSVISSFASIGCFVCYLVCFALVLFEVFTAYTLTRQALLGSAPAARRWGWDDKVAPLLLLMQYLSDAEKQERETLYTPIPTGGYVQD